MSENKSAPRDRTPLYIAIVGATATILAALISQLPNLMNRSQPTPTPIIITATPPQTFGAQANNVVPTETSAAPTATTLPNTLAPTATETPFSPPTELRAASATPLPPSPTRSNVITLLLINNLPRAMEFFVDGQSLTTINSGAYQPLRITPGTHEFKQCVLGSDYNAPENCFAKNYSAAPNPDVWEMFDSNHPLVTGANSVLLVLNRAQSPQDFFVDNQFQETVPPNAYTALTVRNGAHFVQPCAVGTTPPAPSCGDRIQINFRFPTHYFVILGESS